MNMHFYFCNYSPKEFLRSNGLGFIAAAASTNANKKVFGFSKEIRNLTDYLMCGNLDNTDARRCY